MSDGQMGSLAISAETTEARKLGRTVAEFQFSDRDGVTVLASLNVDEQGLPMEVDVWKTDFSPLLEIPDLSGADA
jgi:hypothetical protein